MIKKLVWDTSAILNMKEPDQNGYSPARSLFKDLSDGSIPGPYQNIFPVIAVFEVFASVSRKQRDGEKILRDFYIIDEYSIIYNIDQGLIRKSNDIVTMDGFDNLRGADLIFACIAYLEKAYLVTLDNHFQDVSRHINIINLNDSRKEPRYRDLFGI